MVLGLLCFCTLPLHAQKNGNGNVAPPTPTIASLAYLTPGTTTDLAIGGDATGNQAYVASQGNKVISAAFSRAGVTINSITVNSGTSLTLNITVTAGAELGASTLTVTNPSNNSNTSIGNIIHVTDVPVITATQLNPNPASVIDDITASVTGLTNNDGSLTVSYSYLWYEDGVAMAETNATLPASATQQSSSYHCEITPSKIGSIIGTTVSTAPIVVSADKDGNGIHDQWEDEVVMVEPGVDPNGDPDGDGLTNHYEYLFGLDPHDPNSNQPVVKPQDPVTREFQYSRAVNKLDGVTYKVETSSDLATWTELVGATQALNNVNPNSEVVTVGFPAAIINANARLFVRVSAE